MAFGEGGDGATAPLISSDRRKHHLNIVRSGNEWTASAHVITAVIGSGVLSLAWSIAQLGWVAGPGMMIVFASVTALQSTIFADCYRSPDPEVGPHRNRTYAHAVERNLGSTNAWVCMLLQQTALFGYGIAYTITASISFRSKKEKMLGCLSWGLTYFGKENYMYVPLIKPPSPTPIFTAVKQIMPGALVEDRLPSPNEFEN